MAYGDHLHFVINTTQDNTYAFRECPDLNKGEIAIGNQGLCRSYMTARTVDPIAWIESQGYGTNLNGTLASNNNTQPNATTNTNTVPRTKRRMPMIPIGPSVQTPVTSALTEKAMTAPAETATTQKTLPSRTVTAQQVSKNEIAYASVDSTKTASNGTSIEVNNVSKLNEDFLNKYNITLTPSFGNSMNVGQTSSLVLTITDKNTGKPFAGMLPKEITVIPTQSILTLSPQVIRLTNNEGKAVILISADRSGSTDLIVSYNMKSVAKISVSVR